MSVDVPARPAARPRHRHTPRVRRLAAEAGVDLTTVAGTGPAGRVTTDDVRRAGLLAETEPAPAGDVAGRAADVMLLTSVVEVDVTTVLAGGVPLAAHLAAAVAGALGTVPELNGGSGRPIELAVTGDGATTVLSGAGDLGLDGIARRLPLGGSTPSAATFSLVDAGPRGVLWESSPVPAGQVAVLAAGAVVERPAVVHRPDGERVIAVRNVAHLALTYDAGRVDAAAAARFLAVVRHRLA